MLLFIQLFTMDLEAKAVCHLLAPWGAAHQALLCLSLVMPILSLSPQFFLMELH